MRRFVLDAATAASWPLAWERHERAVAVLRALAAGAEALVPAVWPYELSQIVNGAVERGYLPRESAEEFGELLEALPIEVAPTDSKKVFRRVRALAIRYGLTVEMASYLEIAVSEGLPLATAEDRLAVAADQAGVPLFVGAEDLTR